MNSRENQNFYSSRKCLHELFEEQVNKTPEQIAIIFNNQEISYQTLNSRANKLAYELLRQRILPEARVAILAERSIEMVSGILGILKAGGVYIPLDPNDPDDRLEYILNDIDPQIILVQQKYVGKFSKSNRYIIALNNENNNDLRYLINPSTTVTPENLAYIIFTSGSTGRPKGAMNCHSAVINRIMWMQQTFCLSPEERVIQKTPYTFDVSVWEIFWPLICGACLVISKPDGHYDPNYLIELINKYNVSTIHFVPSMLQVFLQSPGINDNCKSLKQVICSGEALSINVEKLFFEKIPSRLFNLYGPTETAIDVTAWECKPDNLEKFVPIGYPIINSQVFILDKKGNQILDGSAGEIFIGGSQVGRGYLNHPDLTAERFIPNPFSDKPGERLYKTGDVGKLHKNGCVEFLGRVDNQVKVRGFRIELNEIEYVLTSHPSILSAFVSIIESDTVEKRLIAYILPKNEANLTINSLRNFLKSKIPEYMIPSFFVFVDSFPVTKNGKLDRNALPKPFDRDFSLIGKIGKPRNRNEQILKEIWEKILQRKEISIYDSFFELGGDSILGIQIISRALSEGLQFTIKQLFEYQTIAELSEIIQNKSNKLITQKEIEGTIPLSPIQHWFFEQRINEVNHYNQAILLEIDHDAKEDLVKSALQWVFRYHDAFRIRFLYDGKSWFQEYLPSNPVIPIIPIDLSRLPKYLQSRHLRDDAGKIQSSLNITNGPIAQITHFRLGDGKPSLLLIVIHHLIIDGISWRVILEDFKFVYNQLKKGDSPNLSTKTDSYQKWANSLLAYAKSDSLKSELNYWESQINVNNPSLPFDFLNKQNSIQNSFRNTFNISLSSEETDLLLHLLPEIYHTQMNDVLLAALISAYHSWTNNSKLIIDLEGHGREEIDSNLDITRTVGWFTSLFPFCLEIEPNSTVEQILFTIKKQLRLIPNRGMGYGILKYLSDDVNLKIRLHRYPQPQISFNYLGQFDQTFSKNDPFHIMADSAFLGITDGHTGSSRALNTDHSYLIEITCAIIQNKFEIALTYCSNLFVPDTISKFAINFIGYLKDIISLAKHTKIPENSLNDFPLVEIDPPTLNKIILTNDFPEDIYPLSPMQEGMLFHSIFSPSSGVYIEQLLCTIKGPISISIFQQAWQLLMDENPILRTKFIWSEIERPLQIVDQKVTAHIAFCDWQNMPKEDQKKSLEIYLQKDRYQDFVLSTAPLMRIALFQKTEREFTLIWTHHHILLDGWSLPIVLEKLWENYSFLQNRETERNLSSFPYRIYINWLMHQNTEDAKNFWKAYLCGINFTRSLTSSNQNIQDIVNKEKYKKKQVKISDTIYENIQCLAKKYSLTVNSILLGTWGILLSHFIGLEDIVFGVVISGRPLEIPNIDKMIGLFINTIPFRIQIKNVTAFSWFQKIQEDLVELNQFAYCPLSQIQKWSDIPKGDHLFDSILVFDNYAFTNNSIPISGGNISTQKVHLFEQTNYPLSASINSTNKLVLTINYNASYFSEKKIDQILKYFEKLIEAILESPIASLKETINLVDFSNIPTDKPIIIDATPYSIIHSTFENIVLNNYDSIALIDGDNFLTYEQLNNRANQLAHHLQKKGVEPGSIVGICIERSELSIISLLAVLKAGGVYLPLDPAFPIERLNFIINNSCTSMILTSQSTSKLFDNPGSQIESINIDNFNFNQEPINNLQIELKPDDLAYIIYTSGSTGTPKGVTVSHFAATTHFYTMKENLKIKKSDRVLQFASASFDVSLEQIFTALFSGATIVIRNTDWDFWRISEQIISQKITVVNFPTAYWRQMLIQATQKELLLPWNNVRLLIIGGDKLFINDLRLPDEISNNISLVNAYGPTEAVITSTIFFIPSDFIKNNSNYKNIPIGKPLPGRSIYILDKNLIQVPNGKIGEIYIGGDILARGYINQPIATSEKFIPDCFSDRPGRRLYKTGDMGRLLPDGNIELIGRMDSQVKIRGFRIELEEVEIYIKKHPNICESLLFVLEDEKHEKRILAYYTVYPDKELKPEELRNYLLNYLPTYMIPSYFFNLPSFPLNPTGKINYDALPKPTDKTNLSAFDKETYLSSIEKIIIEIWQKTLGIEKIGINDNYFQLGGDSILSIQIVSRARQRGIHFTPRDLFLYQTISELVYHLNLSNHVEKTINDFVEKAPLTAIQQWFFEQNFPNIDHWNQAILLDINSSLDINKLIESIQYIVNYHDAFNLSFVRDGIDWYQSINKVIPNIELDQKNFSKLSKVEQTIFLENCFQKDNKKLNITNGPLITISLFFLGDDQPKKLIIIVHHLIIDGVSWRIFIEELEAVYNQLCQGLQVRIPEKTTPFLLWATKINEYANSPTVLTELDYWIKNTNVPTSKLPTDYNKNCNSKNSYKKIIKNLSIQETEALLREIPSTYNVQVIETLLTALAESCSSWTKNRCLLLDLEGHGREIFDHSINISRTIGWFTTIFPIRLDLSNVNKIELALQKIKKQYREVPNNGMGFGLLRYLCKDKKIINSMQNLAQPEITFNYLGQFDHLLSNSSIFKFSEEPISFSCDKDCTRKYLIEVTCFIQNQQFFVQYDYDELSFKYETIENLCNDFVKNLQSLIRKCKSEAVNENSTLDTDVTFAGVDENQLKKISRIIANKRGDKNE